MIDERPLLLRLETFDADFDQFYSEPVPMMVTQICADCSAEIASLRAQLDEAKTRASKLEKELEVEEHSHEQTVEDRDVAEDWADKLVERVEQLLDVDCGEHSNLNSPWKEACDYLDGAIANLAKPSSADEARRKAIEECAAIAEACDMRLLEYPNDTARTYYESAVMDASMSIATIIRALLSESKT